MQRAQAFTDPLRNGTAKLPNVTHSGYLDVNKNEQAALFYAYYERQNDTIGDGAPVILWLQVRRTCPLVHLISYTLMRCIIDVMNDPACMPLQGGPGESCDKSPFDQEDELLDPKPQVSNEQSNLSSKERSSSLQLIGILRHSDLIQIKGVAR